MNQECRNKFDSRCGFVDLPEDERVSDLNREANKAMSRRIKYGWYTTRPKMSHVLKFQREFPHVEGHFIMRDGRACALGVIHLKAGGNKYQKEPDWAKIDGAYQLAPAETHRQVICPVCSTYRRCGKPGYDNIMARIFHLNDYHGWSSFKIGVWLEIFNL